MKIRLLLHVGGQTWRSQQTVFVVLGRRVGTHSNLLSTADLVRNIQLYCTTTWALLSNQPSNHELAFDTVTSWLARMSIHTRICACKKPGVRAGFCKTLTQPINIWFDLYLCKGARGGAVGWGTALQAGKFAGSIPDYVIVISHWYNPSGRTMPLGSTQPLTEMSTRNISWGVKTAGA
jgi:hypothetical protein